MTRASTLAVLFVAAAAAVGGRERPVADDSPVAASTRRMAERLAAIFRAQDFRTDPYKNGERAKYLRQMLESERQPGMRVRIERARGEALLLQGNSAEAVEVLEGARRAARTAGLGAEVERDLRGLLITAYFRLGEQQNCLLHHGAESCLFPIRGSGVHGSTEGSRHAAVELLEALRDNPSDMHARWLLNIASMTLGEPTPRRWEIPAERFDSEFDIGRFHDVGRRGGREPVGLAGGAIADDFDGDGRLDVMVSSSGPARPDALLPQQRRRQFAERTDEAGLTGETGGLNMVQADYDNDGDVDILVLRGGWLRATRRLPATRCCGTTATARFTDVTEAAGLAAPSTRPRPATGPTTTTTAGSTSSSATSRATQDGRTRAELFRNNGDGTFTDVAAAGRRRRPRASSRARPGATTTTTACPDLYVSNMGGRNRLLPQRRPTTALTFTDVAPSAGVDRADGTASRPGSGTTTTTAARPLRRRLLQADGHRRRRPPSYLGLPHERGACRASTATTATARFDDVAHELGLDRVIAADGRQLRRPRQRRLARLLPRHRQPRLRGADAEPACSATTRAGASTTSRPPAASATCRRATASRSPTSTTTATRTSSSRWAARSRRRLHERPLPEPRLRQPLDPAQARGVRRNRSAIGARIRVHAMTDRGPRASTAWSAAAAASAPPRSAGDRARARAVAVEPLEVWWPASGKVQTLRGFELDWRYRVREGDDRAVPAPPAGVK